MANAIKFTQEGGNVWVRTGRAGTSLTLSVTDDGPGISAEFLPHVFERFRQAEGHTARAHQGLGLGLDIAKNLIELHHGSIEASSDGEGRGATFVITIPSA